MSINIKKSEFGRALVIFSVIVVSAFMLGRLVAIAQVWDNPISSPPSNNPGQPDITVDVSAYVKKSVTTEQIVEGPVTIAQGTSLQSQLGGDNAGDNVAVTGSGSATIALPPIGNHGVFAQGVGAVYGLVGFSDVGATGAAYGVMGQADANGIAGQFFGPVTIVDNSDSSVSGSLTVVGDVIIDEELKCLSSAGCSFISPWIDITSGVPGLSSFSSNNPAIDIDISGTESGSAIEAVSTSMTGLSGEGLTGIIGRVVGSKSGVTYTGISGSSADGGVNFTRYGAWGNVADDGNGGVTIGSSNYGTAIRPKYDNAAGFRACVKGSSGDIINKKGIRGNKGSGVTFGTHAALFDDGLDSSLSPGDILIATVCSHDSFQRCTVDADCAAVSTGSTCEGKLQIGNNFITKRNLIGLKCKAAGTADPADCYDNLISCGNGIQEIGEVCDDRDGGAAGGYCNSGCSSFN